MSSMQPRILTRDEVAKHNQPEDLWIIIDSKVYDISKFKAVHPGGLFVLLDEEVAGKDAMEAFFSLHRFEVLEKPQYKRLQVGVIEGEKPVIHGRLPGEISKVPYAEPTWLSEGYHSPYYTEGHKKFQKAARNFFDEVVYPDSIEREPDGKRPSQSVIDKMTELNMHAMRMGPGRHLKGRLLMNGLEKPEEFDYFTRCAGLNLEQEALRGEHIFYTDE